MVIIPVISPLSLQNADAAGPLGDWGTHGVYARLPRGHTQLKIPSEAVRTLRAYPNLPGVHPRQCFLFIH